MTSYIILMSIEHIYHEQGKYLHKFSLPRRARNIYLFLSAHIRRRSRPFYSFLCHSLPSYLLKKKIMFFLNSSEKRTLNPSVTPRHASQKFPSFPIIPAYRLPLLHSHYILSNPLAEQRPHPQQAQL